MRPLSQEKFKKLQRRNRFLVHQVHMFQQVMEGTRSGMQLEKLLKIVIQSVCRGMGFKRCGIFLVEPDGKFIRLAMGIDDQGRFEKDTDRFALTSSRKGGQHSNLVNGYKRYFLTNNVPKRFTEGLEDGSTVYNLAIVPISLGKGRVIGTLAVDNLNVHRAITRTDVSTLLNFSTQVGLAIESVKSHEEMVSLSITDSLTGLHNRRFFEKSLHQEIQRCRRYKRSFSLLTADIDYFKKVNDTYGHDVGDRVLKHVAVILRDNLRSLDMIARIGGEEFAILLPETPPQNLSVVTRRLLKKVRESIPPIPVKGAKKPQVTISLGVSSYRGGEVTAHQIIKLSDESLYQAKNSGRDKCGPVRVAKKR
jgi:diguanylate cyclase (GGDEF)-like protein